VRIVLFSDIHSAPAALTALLDEVNAKGVDALWCLGDLVGYGPAPLQVIYLLRGLLDQGRSPDQPPHIVLQGNHDQGVAFGNELFQFDAEARAIVVEQRATLPEADLGWLGKLPLFQMPLPGYCLAHGAFVPQRQYDLLWVYGTQSKSSVFQQLKTARAYCDEHHTTPRVIAVGHSHIPTLWQWNAQSQTLIQPPIWAKKTHYFENVHESPLVLNPGSITLPREGVAQPCATYILMDIQGDRVAIEFCQLYWDWRDTVRQMPSGYHAGARLRRLMRYAPLPDGVSADEVDLL